MRAIETVDSARKAGVPHASYEEVLLKCIKIREGVSDDLAALRRYKDSFVEDELEWEEQRHDPLYVLRNRLQTSDVVPTEVELEGKTYYKVGEKYVYDDDAKYVGELVGGVLRRMPS